MDFNIILRDVLYALVVAIAGISVKFIISLAKKGVTYLEEKIDSIKDERLKEFCKQTMEAAETMVTELLTGEEKKKWVLDQLTAFVAEKKINVTEEQLSNLVQSIFQQIDGITINTYKHAYDLESIVSKTIDKVLETKKEEVTEE